MNPTHSGPDHGAHGHQTHHEAPIDGAAARPTIKDPVCGMAVDPAKSSNRADFGGQAYYFCSVGCHDKFVAEPQLYAQSAPRNTAVALTPEGTIYTCPMHPQIRQVGPGNCPICGMTLEDRKSVV